MTVKYAVALCEPHDALDLIEGQEADEVSLRVGQCPVGRESDHVDVRAGNRGLGAAHRVGENGTEDDLGALLNGFGRGGASAIVCFTRIFGDDFEIGYFFAQEFECCS